MVDRMKAPLQKQRKLNPAIPLLWLAVAMWGSLALVADSNRPGPAGSPPAQWPPASKLPSPSEKPTLIMFVHPNCACSKASLGELSLLMTRCQGRVDTHVLFLWPAGQPANQVPSDLWRQASAIPGVRVALDENGREARLFRTETSGAVVLYGAEGRLQFQGGMTLSRGHLGDNPGCAALQSLIYRQPSRVTQTPVFGCRLSRGNLTAKN
jgi:hypothetical protein